MHLPPMQQQSSAPYVMRNGSSLVVSLRGREKIKSIHSTGVDLLSSNDSKNAEHNLVSGGRL